MFTNEYVPFADRIPNDLPDQDCQDDDKLPVHRAATVTVCLAIAGWIVVGGIAWAVFA